MSFKEAEMNLRSGNRRDPYFEKLLDKVNFAMADIDNEVGYGDGKYPIVFIIGLHRSGTTLLNQILAHTSNYGYINNIIARFWRAPVFGIQLSKQLIGEEREINFNSNYGKTNHISGPHEFSFFWHHWFKII